MLTTAGLFLVPSRCFEVVSRAAVLCCMLGLHALIALNQAEAVRDSGSGLALTVTVLGLCCWGPPWALIHQAGPPVCLDHCSLACSVSLSSVELPGCPWMVSD